MQNEKFFKIDLFAFMCWLSSLFLIASVIKTVLFKSVNLTCQVVSLNPYCLDNYLKSKRILILI